MNYVYTTVTENFIPHYKAMRESLASACPGAKLLTTAVNMPKSRCGADFEASVPDPKSICGFRVSHVANLAQSFKNGVDSLVVLDSDTLVQGDIFGMFREKYCDVLLTSRQYPCRYPVNAGVQGYKITHGSKNFLKHYASQLKDKTWPPFVDFQKRFKRFVPGYNWLDDQDYLCAVYLSCVIESKDHPAGISIDDVGPYYNWSESEDSVVRAGYPRSVEGMLKKIGDPRYKVLHFRGGFKSLMLESEGAGR